MAGTVVTGGPVIAVCLNPAVDVTYGVAQLRPGESHRVGQVERRPGGKGVNVARVLTQLDTAVLLLGFGGGGRGAELSLGLSTEAVAHLLVPVTGETRSTVTVVADGIASVFNETGPTIGHAEWAAFVGAFEEELDGAGAVVLSGSQPPGVSADAYAQLTARARRRGVPVIVDAEGRPLALAVRAGPSLAKPNATEAAALLGHRVDDDESALRACRALVGHGAEAAVVSRGADGLAAVLDGRGWTARLPVPMRGNPTGAGDALTAALARGLLMGAEPADLLADGVALAGAAVAAATAGSVVPGLADALRRDAVLTQDCGEGVLP